MCTYNGELHIQSQLESIAGQSLLPSELVICDDGSTDTTLALVSQFAEGAPFEIRVHRNPQNLGYTKNFEQAISMCEGEFIALSDQDDLWYPEKLATLSSLLRHDDTLGGVFSDGDLLNSYGEIEERSLWQSIRFSPKKRVQFTSGYSNDILLRGNVVTGMTMMFRSELRDRLLPIPRTWIHDAWLAWMLNLNSRLYACPTRLVSYRMHPSQQVGLPLTPGEKRRWIYQHGLSAYFKRAKTRSLLDYHQTAAQLDDLCEYLKKSTDKSHRTLLVDAEKKSRHAKTAAAALTHARPARIKAVLGHASSYWKYSTVPARAIFRDLLI